MQSMIAESLSRKHVPPHTSAEARAMERVPPFVRGFWTDDELLEDSGLGSVAVLKKVAGTRWLQPSHCASPDGGRRRVWTFGDVVRAGVVVEVSAHVSVPLIAAGMILDRATSTWVEAGINLKARIGSLTNDQPFSGPTVAGHRLVIVNSSNIWLEAAPDQFELISQDAELTGSKLLLPRAYSFRPVRFEILLEQCVALTVIDVGNLTLPIFGKIKERIVQHCR